MSSAVLAATAPLPVAPAYSPRVDYGDAQRTLVTWTPGEVQCEGGVAVVGQPVRRPANSLGWPTVADRPAPKVTIAFDIDASGRPVSIRTKPPYFINADVAPALAASRFPAAARQGCTITYVSEAQPLATVPLADLISYSVTPTSGPLPPQGWARIRSAGTCSDKPRQQPLVRVFPDFTKLPGTPGVRDWTLVSYDTNAGGEPINARTVSSTGNTALDVQGAEAVRKSRFTGGARTACAYPYWRAAEVLRAPPMPEDGALVPAGANCPAGQQQWATPPKLAFPAAYARRAIEGWAIVSYDIAPWGAIGNAKVLAAQPSEDFGKQAMQMLQSAKVAPSPRGATGCIGRIKFVMPADETPTDGEQGEAPAPIAIF